MLRTVFLAAGVFADSHQDAPVGHLHQPAGQGTGRNAGSVTLWRTVILTVLWALLLVVGAANFSGSAMAREPLSVAELETVALAALPAQAQETRRLIQAGGPFPYEKDGTVFGNRERILPRQPRGYYREYTVRTPGARNRGARRIVCGGQQPREPDACFYTEDHYSSFRRIVQ